MISIVSVPRSVFYPHADYSLLGKSDARSSPSDLVMRLLERLVGLERDFANRVFKSKQREDSRGDGTLPGYKSSHISAEDDMT